MKSLDALIDEHVAVAVQHYLALAVRERWQTLGEAQRAWAELAGPIVDTIVAQARPGLTAAAVHLRDLEAFRDMVWNRIVSIDLPAIVFARLSDLIVRGSILGWSAGQLSQRLTVDLGWSVDAGYWEVQQGIAREALETRLAGLTGEARELAKASDPVVHALQDDLAEATTNLGRSMSPWQTRAERIARTEATAANNFAALAQLEREEWTHKQWVSGIDARVRPSHRAASGQVVPIDGYFTVGGISLKMPGDYDGPAEEVINCRCTIVGTMGDRLET